MAKKPIIYKDLIPFKNKIDQTVLFNTKEKDKTGRHERFMKQRKKFGFDERETWCLAYTTILWLYTHLKRYKAWCCVELYDEDFAHQYRIPVIDKDKDNNYIYDKIKTTYNNKDTYSELKFKITEKELTIGQTIDLICEYFEIYINEKKDEELNYALAEHGMKLYAQILSSLWW